MKLEIQSCVDELSGPSNYHRASTFWPVPVCEFSQLTDNPKKKLSIRTGLRERRVEFVRGQRWFVKLTPSPSEGWLAFRVVTLTKIDLIIYANNFLLMSHWHYWLRNYLSTTEFALQRPASLLNERYWIRVVVRRCERSYRYWIDIRRMNVHIRNQATRKEPQTADALFGTSNQQHNHD